MTRYRTIVVDPPWHYEAGKWVASERFPTRNPGLPYETMTLDDIKALDVPAAANSHLYLWTTNRYLRDAYDVADAWGFRFSTLLVWCKPIHGEGPGGAFTITSEYVLFCRRGNLPTLKKQLSTWFEAPRGRHSEKPDAFYDLVEQVSPEPRIDMFSRRARLGWGTWGIEALHGGEATLRDGFVDDQIDAWHASGPEETRPLHEYLGWSWDEYRAWVEGRAPTRRPSGHKAAKAHGNAVPECAPGDGKGGH